MTPTATPNLQMLWEKILFCLGTYIIISLYYTYFNTFESFLYLSVFFLMCTLVLLKGKLLVLLYPHSTKVYFYVMHLKIIVAWKEKNEEILAAVKAEEAKHTSSIVATGSKHAPESWIVPCSWCELKASGTFPFLSYFYFWLHPFPSHIYY